MGERVVAIRLKIPDNEAFTALTALRRLGVEVAAAERAVIWCFEDNGSPDDFVQRVERNETLFNPNKHALVELGENRPRAGEAWIEELGSHADAMLHLGGKPIPGIVRARRYVAWRLFNDSGEPAASEAVSAAVDRLLCNPAIERALTG